MAGCAGQSDSTPQRDDGASASGDRVREIERKATNRAAMYGHFRETFSREYTYDELVSQALTPLGTLLETMEVTDRMGGDPPAVAAAVAIAPLPDPVDALSEAKDVMMGRRYSAADAIYQCGAYTEALDTACMDSPDARVEGVRDRNGTLRTKAQAVADAAGAYRSSRTDENRARLVAAMRAEFEHTAPLPALAVWTEIDASAYANRTQWEEEGVEYVRNLATANASSIVAARAYLSEQLAAFDGESATDTPAPTRTPTEQATERRRSTPEKSENPGVGTVRQYYDAIETGDSAKINRYTTEPLNVTQDQAARLQEQLRRYSDRNVLFEQRDGRTVEVFVVLDTTIDGRTASTAKRYTLVRRNGEWLISERRNGLAGL